MQATGGFLELNDLHYKYVRNLARLQVNPEICIYLASVFRLSDSSMLPGPMGPWTAYDCMNSVAARDFWVLYSYPSP